MRHVILTGHDAPTTPDFPLNDLPGGAGRMDLLARSLVSTLLLSHDIRADARATLVLADEVALRFEGSDLRGLHPDERSTAAQIRAALEEVEDLVGPREVEVRPGIYASRRGFEAVVRDASEEGTVVQLHEDGEPAGAVEPPADPVLVLSDHRDFADEEHAVLDEVADLRISLGPERIHADDAIAVAHNWLDTAGFEAY